MNKIDYKKAEYDLDYLLEITFGNLDNVIGKEITIKGQVVKIIKINPIDKSIILSNGKNDGEYNLITIAKLILDGKAIIK